MDGSHGGRLNFWLINLALLLALLLGGWLYFTRQAEVTIGVDLAGLSYLMDERRGRDAPLDPFETQLFAGGESVKREYRHLQPTPDSEPVWLLAVQTVKDRHAHHPPEYCYTGSGWEIVDSRPADWQLPDGSRPTQAIARIEIDGKTHSELMAYWFTDGEQIADSYFQRVAAETWQKLTGQPRSWLMLRVAIPIDAELDASGPSEQQLAQLAGFAAEVERAVRRDD